MNLGEIIRQLREGSGLTQKQLGARIGVSDSAVCQIERGRTKNPRIALIARILYELKAPPGYVFKEAGLPVYGANPSTCEPPMLEVCEIINGITESQKRGRLESLLLEAARAWRDYPD